MPNLLTKQALKRLQQAPVEVRLFNGCFNVASVKAKFSNYSVELRVEVTHPALVWQCGDKNEVTLLYWKNCIGTFVEVPLELNVLVETLRAAGTMSNEQARARSKNNSLALTQAFIELGFSDSGC